METPKEYHYVYYSYEEYGKGYIGSRTCDCSPEKDINYFGSFSDKNFKPTQKIILKDDYITREEAYADEIILQKYYKVVENPHFANRSYQTSTKFCVSKQKAREIGKDAYKNKTGIHSYTFEERSEIGKKYGKSGSKKAKELGVGIFSMSECELSNAGKKGSKNTNFQKWQCLETGFISNSGALTGYQRKRGIDTSNRIRVS
jgi:hypothetical protein